MNPAKRRGTAWESAVVTFFRSRGIHAYRPAQSGAQDVGDVHGVSPVILQCKDVASLAQGLGDGTAGARRQAVAAGERWGVAVLKRRGKSTGEAYVAMSLDTFAEILEELRKG